MKLSTTRSRWGVPLFDNNYRGLPANSFNLLETVDRFSGLLGIACFIKTGLEQGETVTLIAFDSPENVLQKFANLGFDFSDAIDSERLLILSYKPTFTRSLNISTDYQALFAEIDNFSDSKSTRLAFLNADLLFNLESYNLTTISVSKIHHAAQNIAGTILAQFTTVDDIPHRRLRNISASLLDCYLVISRKEDNKMSLEVKTYH
ncbi:MAG: hypothetical protein R3F02_15900 [Thiolinea sp.]